MTAEQVQEQHDQQSAKALQRQQSLKRFRVVGKVVQALNRFTAALNPTYNYGQAKEESAGGVPPHKAAAINAARALTAQARLGASPPKSMSLPRSNSGRTASGRPASGTHYGHKGNLLFKSLPSTERKAHEAP